MTVEQETPRQKTGRRKAVDIQSPRDKPVCFTLSQEEKAAVDTLGVCTRLTRSALLAKITLLYLESVVENRSTQEQKESEKQLIEFIAESRKAVRTTPAWQKEITTKPRRRRKRE
ncbi:hypothetical protein [Ruficoccus sp. ZRK36]|uniref:hypothetical protein n=1 Tax=Ruficoccus sp. ZRK36 TaxID=2866311 RepID=UPI001C7398A6|nr:hypothetical protein [Ruficoccus sp. ZRK36]QYY36465.1 hypothetical protein K0V07_03110 [Ruficoccus sp. ZRK36]